MPTIKEQIQQMNSDYETFYNNIDEETKKSEQAEPIIRYYVDSVFVPTYARITAECEAIGHVNLETISRDDEEQTRYYICDGCGKQVELGPTPQ